MLRVRVKLFPWAAAGIKKYLPNISRWRKYRTVPKNSISFLKTLLKLFLTDIQ